MPLLHSIVLARPDGYHLDAVASDPPLKVNGRSVESADLADGDLIEIGTFRLEVALSSPGGQRQPQHSASQEQTAIDHDREFTDPAELSAEELVDLLDAEMQMVDEFDNGTMVGAEALLDAALREQDKSPDTVPMIPIDSALKQEPDAAAASVSAEQESPELAIHRESQPATESQGDLATLVAQLQEFVHGMDSRSQRATEREMFLAEAISEIFESQQQMAEQIEQLAGQLATLKAREQSPTQRRAIA